MLMVHGAAVALDDFDGAAVCLNARSVTMPSHSTTIVTTANSVRRLSPETATGLGSRAGHGPIIGCGRAPLRGGRRSGPAYGRDDVSSGPAALGGHGHLGAATDELGTRHRNFSGVVPVLRNWWTSSGVTSTKSPAASGCSGRLPGPRPALRARRPRARRGGCAWACSRRARPRTAAWRSSAPPVSSTSQRTWQPSEPSIVTGAWATCS